MQFPIEGKIFVVTGAASGIGAGIVKSFLEEGAQHVAILDVAENEGITLEKSLIQKHGPGKVKFFKCDVTNEEQFTKALEETKAKHGRIDALVNNAGIMNDSKKCYKKMIEVNVTGVVMGTLKAIEIMRKDKGAQGGTVINISSIAALFPSELLPIYFCTKSAVLQFTTSIGMGKSYERTGVRCITVCFGVTDTPLLYETKTCGYDDETTTSLNEALKGSVKQRPESAVRGVVEAYKKGTSSSTWLAYRDKDPIDISEDIKNGYTSFCNHLEVLF